MKILIVSNMYPSIDNPGYGVFVKNFEDEIVDQGDYVDHVVIKGRANGKIDKIFKYIVFSIKLWFFYLFKKYDVIYVHYIAHSLIPLVPIYFIKNTALVCNAHGEDLLPRNKYEEKIYNFVSGLVSKSKFLVVPSEYFKEIAVSKFPNLNVVVSPSGGIDGSIFSPKKSPKGYFYNKKKLRIGFVSRIDKGKGWDILLNSIPILQKKSPNLDLEVVIVGEGVESDKLLQRIKDLSLNKVVNYMGGMAQGELPSFYQSLDVFVFPTIRKEESLGLVGLEAMACGIPSICSDIGGIKTYIEDGVNGYLFTPGSHEELADSLLNYSGLDLSEFLNMSDHAIKTAKKYDRKVVISDLRKKLAGLLK